MKVKIFSFLAVSALVLAGCGGGNTASSTTSQSQTNGTPESSPMTNSANAAHITGVVKFTGTAPKPKKISMAADAFCKTAHAESVAAEDIVVSPNGALGNVYVYVKSGLGQATFPAPKEPAVLDQEGCLYKPHVLAVQTGQEVIIRNSDGVLHNVNARPTNNKPFNIGQPVKGMENKKVFETAEMAIPVKCDVHPWMGGFIVVQTHSFHDVTGTDGSFDIGNLPPGTYEIGVWHEKLGTATQSVTVGAEETKSITFSFSGSAS